MWLLSQAFLIHPDVHPLSFSLSFAFSPGASKGSPEVALSLSFTFAAQNIVGILVTFFPQGAFLSIKTLREPMMTELM